MQKACFDNIVHHGSIGWDRVGGGVRRNDRTLKPENENNDFYKHYKYSAKMLSYE